MKLEASHCVLYEHRIKLDMVRRILSLNPLAHIGGSVALYLHGIGLQRIYDASTIDFDLCVPYYIPLTGEATDKIQVANEENRGSDADYKEVLTFNGTKIDYRVDPSEPFHVIRLNEFDYRVTPLEIIMEAKFRYAIRKSKKHRDDCYEICGKQKPATNNWDDLPF